MQATISYLKGKQKTKRKEWLVSTYESAADIMRYDNKTMQSLSDRIYGNTYKGKKEIIIIKIDERKEVGTTNR